MRGLANGAVTRHVSFPGVRPNAEAVAKRSDAVSMACHTPTKGRGGGWRGVSREDGVHPRGGARNRGSGPVAREGGKRPGKRGGRLPPGQGGKRSRVWGARFFERGSGRDGLRGGDGSDGHARGGRGDVP